MICSLALGYESKRQAETDNIELEQISAELNRKTARVGENPGFIYPFSASSISPIHVTATEVSLAKKQAKHIYSLINYLTTR